MKFLTLVLVLVLAACDPLAVSRPRITPPPAIVFVSACPHTAIFQMQVDHAYVPNDATIWVYGPGDALAVPVDSGTHVTEFEAMNLGTITVLDWRTDTLSVTRPDTVLMTCGPR